MQNLRDTPLPCLRCGRELEVVFEDVAPLQPSGGTMFKSRGNYGSTVWDPGASSRDYLLANICDECLSTAAREGRVARVMEIPARPEMHVRPFDPDEDWRTTARVIGDARAAHRPDPPLDSANP